MGRLLAIQFWTYFIGALALFSLLFLVSDFLANSNQFAQTSRQELLQYYFYVLPEILYRMLPVAATMGVIFTFATLQRTNELTALFSLGVSLRQMTSIFLFWLFIVAFMGYYLGDQIVPKSNQKKNYIYYHTIKKSPGLYSTIKTGKIWYKVQDTIFYLQTLNPKTSVGEGLKMFLLSPEWTLLQLIEAKKVLLEGQKWTLENGLVTVFSAESPFPLTQNFESKTIVMAEEASELVETAKASDILTVKELKQFIEKNKQAGLDTLRYEVDYFSKLSFAFAGVVMSLLAIPFALARGRSGGTMGSLGIALGMVFLYWIFYSSGLALGYHGKVPPLLAVSSPNLIMLVGAYFLHRQTQR